MNKSKLNIATKYLRIVKGQKYFSISLCCSKYTERSQLSAVLQNIDFLHYTFKILKNCIYAYTLKMKISSSPGYGCGLSYRCLVKPLGFEGTIKTIIVETIINQ